jgi:hypothetical protein
MGLFLLGMLTGSVVLPILWMLLCIVWPEDKLWDAEH